MNTNKRSKHIGFNVVAYGVSAQDEISHGLKGFPSMEILQSQSSDDGDYLPAQSITVHSPDSIKSLRDFCNELLGEAKP